MRCTDEEICHLDPSEIFSHVELKQMYLGIKTAKIMTEPEFTNKPSAAQLDVLQRCKNFLIALPEELQRRLPINQLMKYLEILNPTVVISGDIPTLPPILTKLPSIISKNLQQDLDPQWRQLPLTSVIVDMVTESNAEIFSTIEFRVKVGKIEEFSLISTLATKLLSLPVSNVACERIFSKVNLLKTNQRNRFTVPGIVVHIFAKQGLCAVVIKTALVFSQQRKMMDKMRRNIYQNVLEILDDSGGDDDIDVKQIDEEDDSDFLDYKDSAF